MSPHTASPTLSVVLTGRNDDYGLGFRDRFFATLRFNHRELTARGIDHEFVFVEWAPAPDQDHLSDLVFREVPELSPDVFRAVVVDPAYQEALSLNPRLAYLEFIAKNVGIRRARGEFVLTSNCDVILGRAILRTLEEQRLTHGVVYRAARHDLKLATDHTNLDWPTLEDPRNLDGQAPQLKPPLMGGGTGDFVMLDRETFVELRGFNEVYRVARIGIDYNFLVKAFSSGVDIADIGGPVYHINHAGSYRLTRMVYQNRESEAPWGNRRWHKHGVVYHNPATWGLATAPTHEQGAGRSFLRFSWNAVPPLVDLRRVVLPVNRVGRPELRRVVSR